MLEESQKKEFIIREDIDGFIIQEKVVRKIKSAFWFWENDVFEENLYGVDKHGEGIYYFKGNKIKIYKTIEEANAGLESIKKYPIYHYPEEKPEFPENL